MISGPPQMGPVIQEMRESYPPMQPRVDDDVNVEAEEPVPAAAAVIEAKDEQVKNDVEVPAFLRRERRLFQ